MELDKETLKHWLETTLHFLIASVTANQLKIMGYYESFYYEIAVFIIIFFALTPISTLIKKQFKKGD